MRRSYGYEEEHYMHEESWQSENECYSYGSGMQMMPRPHSPPKPSKHQMMVNGASNMRHDGWNKDMAQHGWNKQEMAQHGWNKQDMAQHGWNKQDMVQHGWNGTGANLFNKQKPHYGMNESQFNHANMPGGYGKQGNNAYHQMHHPTHSMTVEEEVMYEEHSSWQTNGGGHFNDNFKNWKHNGYNNPQYCMSKAV